MSEWNERTTEGMGHFINFLIGYIISATGGRAYRCFALILCVTGVTLPRSRRGLVSDNSFSQFTRSVYLKLCRANYSAYAGSTGWEFAIFAR